MSTTDVQLRFAADLATFLVALGGVGLALVRPGLLVERVGARVLVVAGFGALGASALLSGAFLVDDPTTDSPVVLRLAGIGLLAVSSETDTAADGLAILSHAVGKELRDAVAEDVIALV